MMTPISKISLILRNGKSVRQSAGAGGLPITRIETIANWNVNPEKVGFAGLQKNDCENWILQDGDILISHINSTKHLGKCAIYRGEPPVLVHGMNLLSLRVDQDLADPQFVYRILTSPDFLKQIPKITKDSVNQSSFNISKFKNLQIPLPPLPEQKRIAAILDAADALRAKRRESIAQLDALVQSTFLEMFGDPVANPIGWDKIRLIDLCDRKRGISYGVVQRGDHDPNGIPVIRIRDILENEIKIHKLVKCKPDIVSKYNRTILQGGELVISIRGTVGRISKVPESLRGGNITREIALIPLKPSTISDFILELIRTEPIFYRLAEDVKGVAQKGINLRDLRELDIIYPPLRQQRRFATIVHSIESQKSRLRAHLAELDTLFASLQSRAFNGEL